MVNLELSTAEIAKNWDLNNMSVVKNLENLNISNIAYQSVRHTNEPMGILFKITHRLPWNQEMALLRNLFKKKHPVKKKMVVYGRFTHDRSMLEVIKCHLQSNDGLGMYFHW